MARRTIPRSLIRQAEDAAAEGRDAAAEESARDIAGAWRAGAAAQIKADLTAREAEAVRRVLSGEAELKLDPAQIDDPLGSDRRPDWREQAALTALRNSIAANGQDQPIHVAPADPDWRPDPRAPYTAVGAQFHLLAGRRRLAALQDLGLPVRAIIAPVEGQGAARRVDMLARRWRENAEREDLSAFERLLSIGELFDAAAAAAKEQGEKPPAAAAFGVKHGLSESVVSRARTVSARKADVIAATPDPYGLSMSALYALLPRLDEQAAPKPKSSPILRAKRKAAGVEINASVSDGALKLSAKTTRALDQAALNALVEDIARKLTEEEAKD